MSDSVADCKVNTHRALLAPDDLCPDCERDALRTQVERLRRALATLCNHHCSGVCEPEEHMATMHQVNEALEAGR